MKILQVNTEKTWRGGERQTCYDIEGMMRVGLDVELLCKKNFPLHQKAVTKGYKTHTVESNLAAILFLITHGSEYDILHAQTAKAQFYAVISKLFHGRKVTYTRRVDFVQKGILTKLKYALTDKVVAISTAIKTLLNAFGVKKVVLISEAVEEKILNKQRAIEYITNHRLTNKKIVATTAAFVQHKDPLTMVYAINELHNLRSDFVFLHFGDGVLKNNVIEKIAELNMQDYYKVVGFMDNVEDFFSVFDLFLMSSEEEGLGSSVLDAFIYKVPVVSTNAGGLQEIIGDRGLVSNIKDYKALAANAHRVLNDTGLHHQLAEKAYGYVKERHSIEKIATAYKSMFEDVLVN